MLLEVEIESMETPGLIRTSLELIPPTSVLIAVQSPGRPLHVLSAPSLSMIRIVIWIKIDTPWYMRGPLPRHLVSPRRHLCRQSWFRLVRDTRIFLMGDGMVTERISFQYSCLLGQLHSH